MNVTLFLFGFIGFYVVVAYVFRFFVMRRYLRWQAEHLNTHHIDCGCSEATARKEGVTLFTFVWPWAIVYFCGVAFALFMEGITSFVDNLAKKSLKPKPVPKVEFKENPSFREDARAK